MSEPVKWKLVPVEPTDEMVSAASAECHRMAGVIDPVMHVWDAMLAASPASPQAEALPPQTSGAEAGDPRPANCRFRLCDEGKPYPKSSCSACGKGIASGLGKRCTVGLPTTDAALAKPASEPAVGGVRKDAIGWNSPGEWEIEQRAFHAAGRSDVPKDVQELVAILWKQYCIAAEPAVLSSSPEEAEALPAGVVTTLIDKTEKLIAAADDMGWSLNSSSADQAISEARDAVRAALSHVSQKDMSSHPRGSGPGPSGVEKLRRVVCLYCDHDKMTAEEKIGAIANHPYFGGQPAKDKALGWLLDPSDDFDQPRILDWDGRVVAILNDKAEAERILAAIALLSDLSPLENRDAVRADATNNHDSKTDAGSDAEGRP